LLPDFATSLSSDVPVSISDFLQTFFLSDLLRVRFFHRANFSHGVLPRPYAFTHADDRFFNNGRQKFPRNMSRWFSFGYSLYFLRLPLSLPIRGRINTVFRAFSFFPGTSSPSPFLLEDNSALGSPPPFASRGRLRLELVSYSTISPCSFFFFDEEILGTI